MGKVKVGIAGASGYTGGELLRLLLHHPAVEVRCAHSRHHAGKPVAEVHGDLLGETALQFSAEMAEDLDLLFLCLGHGESARYLREQPLPAGLRIIDFSQDHRLTQIPDHGFVYGLPELQRAAIARARRVANPGCFATAIQLALLPLAQHGLLRGEIHVSAITGSTGAGQALSETSHFSWRSNNVQVYKPFQHQHLAEIYQGLKLLQPIGEAQINFLPFRGNFTRGILGALYLDCDLSLAQACELYAEYYATHPCVRLSRKTPDLKQVVNTNHCVLYLEKHGSKLFLTSVIDNLLKGASGQAVQNMNLMFGWDEMLGLRLKAVAY
ncbi:MAG: N-acetyl-gamma-glutamyl-phosphate reductase [candidate division KSB1 bacterium]|nr:N-acetyl-gamma-glutamyl-phosphate reductase [candidate division KSB1 bacterium]MDZ7273667.1 N-acetyl-gamma-glutamyl-phosphate reductase [candidate division KSB1 bacterium]MDZ7285823.1 N-acetyl-gamma-glutamyl-phosphate reductase [candidate division KSB1 bacterium]MDZ7298855.1 N-acetyl-gamma-glutamyl-phosphate reductase [candidate division KSB1 bacterium]MDZ7308576.1 N-acetyl-gamma-glutamyl-phosphate reductase [candidate division KSB1 bacterium]